MTIDEARLRAAHTELYTRCAADNQVWPCDVSELLETIKTLRADAEKWQAIEGALEAGVSKRDIEQSKANARVVARVEELIALKNYSITDGSGLYWPIATLLTPDVAPANDA